MSLVDSLVEGAWLKESLEIRKESLNLRLPQQIFKSKKQSFQIKKWGDSDEITLIYIDRTSCCDCNHRNSCRNVIAGIE